MTILDLGDKNESKALGGEKARLLFLIILAAAVRIFFLLRFENMPGYAPGNVERALFILEDPRLFLNFDGGTSTLYKYALASVLYFWRDPLLAPRVFTAFFGTLLILPYYGTLKVLFGRAVAFFSSLILVFYPLHVVQSSITTSDAVYYFFLFGCLYYFFSYQKGQKRFWTLGVAALFFNIASLLRFESWLFIPVFFLLLWPKGKRTAFLFLLLILVFPCAHLALSRCHHGEFLYSFSAAGGGACASIAIGRFLYDPRPWSWLAVLWQSTGPSLVAGGLLGIVLAFLARQKRQLSIFFLVLWLMLTANTLAAKMCAHTRYSIILGLFLIPYACFFAARSLFFLKGRKKALLLLLLVFPVVNFWQVTQNIHRVAGDLVASIPEEVKAVAQWIKRNVLSHETIVIGNDRSDTWQNSIVLQSGIASSRCECVYTPLLKNAGFQNREAFERYLLEHRTRYLVLNTEGHLQKVLNFDVDRKEQQWDNVLFEAVFGQDVPGYGKYVIYRISYRDASTPPNDGMG
ncbi:MAG: glycosyltransferase family 39 protein [Candidatus Omnitrophica bacterium]|nr:glycosyltransferase family 39 protein [Candidatus Omnitrophota bacterium]